MFDNDEFPGGDGMGEWNEEELADELLSVISEEELDQFLGKLARRAIRGAGRFLRSPTGRVVKGALRNLAKATLPAVGAAVGSMVAPGIGTMVGRKLGAVAGGWLELDEAEELTETEAEYEAARRYVRLARQVFRTTARAPRGASPRALTRSATAHAARQHAPALFRQRRATRRRHRRRPAGRRAGGGYWVEPPPPPVFVDGVTDVPDDAYDEPDQEF